MKLSEPNYKKIYEDLLSMKYPNKKSECIQFLSKKKLSELDVLKLEQILFGNGDIYNCRSRKHRSYSKSTIVEILNYQVENKLNNTQLAKHYGLSRNTVTKWKLQFTVINQQGMGSNDFFHIPNEPASTN